MTDISASYHYEPDYEDVLALSTEPPCYDPEYSNLMRRRRFYARLKRMLQEEFDRIKSNPALVRNIRKRHAETFALVNSVRTFVRDPGAILHRKMYLDALHRAQSGNRPIS